MADDESRNEHLPTEGDEIFTENGSETVENDQTGLPPWAAVFIFLHAPQSSAASAAGIHATFICGGFSG